MSTRINLGKVIPTTAGIWNNSTSYTPLTYVKFNDGFYLSKTQNVNKQPDISLTDWQVVIDINSDMGDVRTAITNANTAATSFNNTVKSIYTNDPQTVYSSKYSNDTFRRKDEPLLDLAYGQFTINDNIEVSKPDDSIKIPFNTDIINNKITLDSGNNFIDIPQAGVYNITLNVTVWNEGGAYSAIHIYDINNDYSLASSVTHHFEDREYTLNCSILNHFNQGDKIAFYVEYSMSPTIISNNPISYTSKTGFTPILTNVNIQQIR